MIMNRGLQWLASLCMVCGLMLASVGCNEGDEDKGTTPDTTQGAPENTGDTDPADPAPADPAPADPAPADPAPADPAPADPAPADPAPADPAPADSTPPAP
jgi:hypothetical protein